jgi:deoxyribonuclease V
MDYRPLHTWDVSAAEARRIQERLRPRLKVGRFVQHIRYIAGADVAVARLAPTVYAGVVVLEYATLQVVERQGVVSRTAFPYVPGLLSFREAPALLQAFAKLHLTPDVIIFDGQGIAHPRRLGIASHIGLWLDTPSIGCAKSRLIGVYQEPPPTRGAHAPLYDTDGTLLGAVLRTKTHAKPVFVSVGHRMELEQAIDILLHCDHGYRIPEPTRLADQYVGAMRRAQAGDTRQNT